MADNKGVITAVGRKKLCMAHAGDIALPVITQMAWGSGGADETGQPLDTTGNEIGLYQERRPDYLQVYGDTGGGRIG